MIEKSLFPAPAAPNSGGVSATCYLMHHTCTLHQSDSIETVSLREMAFDASITLVGTAYERSPGMIGKTADHSELASICLHVGRSTRVRTMAGQWFLRTDLGCGGIVRVPRA